MEEVKKCACGMPLDEKTECKCEKGVCIHCCNCEDDCECGCQDKAEEEGDDDEEGCSGCCASCHKHDDGSEDE